MQNGNIVEFEVPGVGRFKALKEPEADSFFMDRRTEIAKILGGRTELIKMEALAREYEKSTNSVEKEIFYGVQIELKRASMCIDVKTFITETPKGFSFEDTFASADKFDALWLALETARRPFQQKISDAPEGTTGITQS
jgi:hypothetical protein